jgi:hypothetical protein
MTREYVLLDAQQDPILKEREREGGRRIPSRIPDAWRSQLALQEKPPEQLTNHSDPSYPSSPRSSSANFSFCSTPLSELLSLPQYINHK